MFYTIRLLSDYYLIILSDYCAITHGVPQGSILGPLLFNIYINSLSNSVEKARVILYADDAVLSCTASTAVELQAILARELNHICEWVLCKPIDHKCEEDAAHACWE